MSAVAAYKEKRIFDNEIYQCKVVYDFAVDAGAVGALDLFKADAAMVITKAYMKVKTACTSGGSATVSVGKSGDAAGIVAATAVASLTTGAVIAGVSNLAYKLAAADVVQVAIAVAALTAGKIEIVCILESF